MTPAELLSDSFDRIAGSVADLLDGLPDDRLTARPADGANTIGWLVWHLTRVQDDHVADVAGTDQVWTADRDGGSFAERAGLPFDDNATGYGMSADEVGRVAVPAALLADYHRAVHEATTAYLATLDADDLDRVVDDSWDPPVTLGARLVSVIGDDAQHVGQAAYVAGLLAASSGG